ncbi:hypothetical protein [Paractinoplanes rishiriensis]|uniref:Uncharacterized protein n=1 Tax=Paractinoplanes rishiriensis TaxID=1050105 RepID=A0A919KB50_9ACTN|nr:hypothetical protein [Actinoplanes rishiriensis]GIF02236.1 hypothetical protein Ari01nite_97000 [Actinoplanes rishiriensis]
MITLFTAALEPSVQAAVVTAIGAVLVALVGIVLELLRRNHKRLGKVTDQVENNHTSNLRDDVDQLLAGVDQLLAGQQAQDSLLREHTRDINGLRADLRHERAERLDVERRVEEVRRDRHR